MRLSDLSSNGPVAMLDPRIVADMADALDGSWTPVDEADPERRARLLAAARLRLYGDRERSGWLLLTTARARDAASGRQGSEWSIGLLPVLDALEDGPAGGEVVALVELYTGEAGLDEHTAHTLAAAVLTPAVSLVVTDDPDRFQHGREGDLPDRLAIIDVATAVARLDPAPGEPSMVSLPADSPLAAGDPWWVLG